MTPNQNDVIPSRGGMDTGSVAGHRRELHLAIANDSVRFIVNPSIRSRLSQVPSICQPQGLTRAYQLMRSGRPRYPL